KHGYKHRGRDDSNREPTEPPARRWVRIVVRSQPFVFQNTEGPIASNNLSFRSAVKTQATVTHGAWLDAGEWGRDARERYVDIEHTRKPRSCERGFAGINAHSTRFKLT